MPCRNQIAVTLFVLMTSGCCFHSGYPYGYYQPSPGYLPQQPMNVYPSGPTYPATSPSYPVPGTPGGDPYTPGSSPGGTGPTPLFQPSNPGSTPNTYSPGSSGNNAPSFNENPGGGNSVPLPGDDPNQGRGGTTQRPALTPTTSANDYNQSASLVQKESRRARPNPSDEGELLVETDSQFQPPVVQTSAADDGSVDFASGTFDSNQGSKKVFAHDPQFSWVQGRVEFNRKTQTWSIMYDLNPPQSDPLGGYVLLADDPQLKNLRSGDTVKIYGTLDDSGDTPIYRLTRFKRL